MKNTGHSTLQNKMTVAPTIGQKKELPTQEKCAQETVQMRYHNDSTIEMNLNVHRIPKSKRKCSKSTSNNGSLNLLYPIMLTSVIKFNLFNVFYNPNQLQRRKWSNVTKRNGAL